MVSLQLICLGQGRGDNGHFTIHLPWIFVNNYAASNGTNLSTFVFSININLLKILFTMCHVC